MKQPKRAPASKEAKEKEKDKRNVEVLQITIERMMKMSDIIAFEGGPKEICDLINLAGRQALDATKPNSKNNK